MMTTLVFSAVALVALFLHAHILGRYLTMALDRSQLNAGLGAVADALLELAEAIARPHADLAEAQLALDDTGTKLQSLALDLKQLKAAEDVDDAIPAPAPEPQPEPEPAPEEEEPQA